MLGILILSAASFLTSPVEEIVLRSGQVIAVDELIRVERGRLIFVTDGGTLYSLRLTDVDIEKTDARLPANRRATEEEKPGKPQESEARTYGAGLPRTLPVSEEEKKRILAEMEGRSHTGRAVPQSDDTEEAPPVVKKSPENEQDEWKWREAARGYRDAIERANERLNAARQRERELSDMLLMYAGSSGDATNYSYLVIQLADLRSMIPQLEGEVRRAEAAWAQFRDDARRQGILPGWLR